MSTIRSLTTNLRYEMLMKIILIKNQSLKNDKNDLNIQLQYSKDYKKQSGVKNFGILKISLKF